MLQQAAPGKPCAQAGKTRKRQKLQAAEGKAAAAAAYRGEKGEETVTTETASVERMLTEEEPCQPLPADDWQLLEELLNRPAEEVRAFVLDFGFSASKQLRDCRGLSYRCP